jgi:hypothetical protein
MACSLRQTLLGKSNKECEMDETCSMQVGDEKTLGRNAAEFLGFKTGSAYNKKGLHRVN